MTTTPDVAGRTACVIGAGVIGTSWTALFLAHGMRVVVHDPRPEVVDDVPAALAEIAPTLSALGLPSGDLATGLSFEPDLGRAVADAYVVQENGPERVDVKQQLWAQVTASAPPDALLLSSSSAITATRQGMELTDAGRLLVGHPFNPPHLIPLVEVVPGERTHPDAVADAVAFYTALAKSPQVVRREVRGFVANRLQRALFAECLLLVQQGVVTVEELDDIVTSSVGLRWAADGPFRSFHLGGGADGFRGYFRQFGPGLRWAIENEERVDLDGDLEDLVVAQSEAAYGGRRGELEAERDRKQLAILRALATATTSPEES
ncbi:3-hydroxyacyl-CoA dehydrogenase NAD-binding domain-containing protein [Nocardioides albidus]|uniref:3-hydroxyacyl-CoA dehydrogenase NAD-binding domain-containing protein n=1 Tax=Nocardioides albidus TaxID=1517589 RepID=UPI00196157C1|nr:3-hydroxyacyl-CoA dehydrogenase NAD-binding domain-containing protein [Nocardioides albidus]